MTALKWITTEAKKLKKQYPKRFATWREYVAQASAIYSAKHKGKSPVGKKKTVSGVKKKTVKKTVTKKPVKKSTGSYHKDTKSHNVNIKVVSGVEKDINRTIEQLKKLQTDLKIAEQNYKKSKDQFTKFYTKQKVDRLKYELRERKFVLTNLYKNIKKSI